jgi:hypothetical protein
MYFIFVILAAGGIDFFRNYNCGRKKEGPGIAAPHRSRNRSVSVSPDGTADNLQLKRNKRAMPDSLCLFLNGD